jgi:hypothetical protein
MNATTTKFSYRGTNWIATLASVDPTTGIGRLSVKPDNHDEDPCNAQGFARSAFYMACDKLSLDPADDFEQHSGGFYARNVKPESVDSGE